MIWHNNKSYSADTINKRIRFIQKVMVGLLPIYNFELTKLSIYAKKNNLELYEIISLRNIIKTQKEINNSRILYLQINNINYRFGQLVNILTDKKLTPKEIKNLVLNFFRKLMMPIHAIIKIIQATNEYKALSKVQVNYITQIKVDLIKMEHDTYYRSQLFETQLANYITRTFNIPFRTELDIRLDKDYLLTPDILFDQPVQIEIGGTIYMIRWMDAKNYTLINVPFIMKSLISQATKYNEVFGLGAFVFRYGFDNNIKIPNVLILDGSIIFK